MSVFKAKSEKEIFGLKMRDLHVFDAFFWRASI